MTNDAWLLPVQILALLLLSDGLTKLWDLSVAEDHRLRHGVLSNCLLDRDDGEVRVSGEDRALGTPP